MGGLTRDGTADPVSLNQILRRLREWVHTGKFICPVQLPIPGLCPISSRWWPHTHTHTHTTANPDNLGSTKEAGGGAQGAQGSSKICISRESVSPLSRLIRGFRNKYHWSPLGRINASGIEWLDDRAGLRGYVQFNKYAHTHTHIAVWPWRLAVPMLLVVSWTGKIFFFLSPFTPDNMASRDVFDPLVPRQPAHLSTQAEYCVYSRDASSPSSHFPQ